MHRNLIFCQMLEHEERALGRKQGGAKALEGGDRSRGSTPSPLPGDPKESRRQDPTERPRVLEEKEAPGPSDRGRASYPREGGGPLAITDGTGDVLPLPRGHTPDVDAVVDLASEGDAKGARSGAIESAPVDAPETHWILKLRIKIDEYAARPNR